MTPEEKRPCRHGGGRACEDGRERGGDTQSGIPHSAIAEALAAYDTPLSDGQAAAAAASITARHSRENDNDDVKRFLLGSTELTSLNITDNDDSILALIEKVNGFADVYPELPDVAAVCTFPNFAALVSQSLEADVKTVCVAGGFPFSQMLPEVKCVETSLAIKDGAEEIDAVLSMGRFIAGDYECAADELTEMKNLCGGRTFKVIIETGVLQNAASIRKAAVFAMYCGADFIKTSTGKTSEGATPAAVYAVCTAIKDYYEKTGNRTGIKIAGGVRTVPDAVGYYTIVKETLGGEWLTRDLFRIGASSLANALVSDITGSEAAYF